MDIVLLEPKTPGNIGAIVRVMKNFDFVQLVLYKPQCDHLCKESIDRATHAKDILHNARVISTLEDYDVLIGTTAIIGTDYNLNRNALTPEMFATMSFSGKVGLVIGREADGMRIDELGRCDFVVTIPSSKAYPTMNVSHAVTILLYEVFKHSNKPKVGDNIIFATKEDKERFLNMLYEQLEKMDFVTAHKRLTQKKLWKKIVGKSHLTRRELQSLYGFVKRIP